MANHLANLKSCVPEFKTGEQGNTAKQWEMWLQNFECCLEFEQVTDDFKDENGRTVSKKRAALLAIGGQQLREIFSTLNIEKGTYAEAIKLLTQYYTPKRNLTAERYKFLCNKPESEKESHLRWITRLRGQVKDCEFDKMNDDEAIKMVMTLHTYSGSLRKQIITGDLDLQQALSKAEMLELADKEIENMNEQKLVINREQKNDEFDTCPVRRSKPSECGFCGGKYPHEGTCPAKSKKCFNCDRKGHLAKVCRSKKNHKEETKTIKHMDECINIEHDVDTVKSGDCLEVQTSKINRVEDHSGKAYPSTEIKVKINGSYIKMEIDSGAEVNIVNEKTYLKIHPRPKLKQTSAKLKPYNSKAIPVKGYFLAEFKANGKTEKETKVFVTCGSSGKIFLDVIQLLIWKS